MAGLRATIYNPDLPNLKQDCYTIERNTARKKIADIKKMNPFSLVGLPTAFELLTAGTLSILTDNKADTRAECATEKWRPVIPLLWLGGV